MKTKSPLVLLISMMLFNGPLSRGEFTPPKEPPAVEATDAWAPVPPVVATSEGGVPSDAIVLFDGKNLDAWEAQAHPGQPAPWLLKDGLMVIVAKHGNNIQTKQAFGDIQLHLEWREPTPVENTDQHRGNSGILFMGGRYELQILDSYENPTYVNGQCGAIYKQYAPLVNASRKPGEWQTYDVVFLGPRFSPQGVLLRSARATVFQNGLLVQYDVAIRGVTTNRGYPAYYPHPDKLPIELQAHDGAIAFRNIWVREVNVPEVLP